MLVEICEGETMIEFTSGDMFEKPVDIRVNTVNCKGVMGAGVALAFKNRYPDMFKDYKKACHDGIVRPGSMYVWKNLLGDWIINFPTKRDWREPSRYDDILAGLEDLRSYLKGLGPVSVALPALGCGHGGLDWGKVSSMVKEKLSDLDARILVFEPTDSRNIGRTVQEQPSNEQKHELEVLGFKSMELPSKYSGEGLPSAVLVKGDETLLTQHWVALLPSKDPLEKELMALEAVAQQLTLEAKQMVVALVHATRATENIVELFLKHNIAVVLILPFGPLTRKAVARTPTDKRSAPFAMLSVASPNEAWGRPVLAQSTSMLRSGASSILLTDASPEWLSSKTMPTWTKRPMFYLRYETQSDDMRRMLERGGARSIGRRPDTGEPNLSPLLSREFSVNSVSEETTTETDNHFTVSLAVATASQLRELANEIEKNPCRDIKVHLTVSCESGTENMKKAFNRILTGVPVK